MKQVWLAVAGLALAVAWAGWLGAIRDPQVVRYRIELAGLQRPLRLVHLSDIHGSAWDMPAVRIARIVGRVNMLRPDLVVITGDFHASKIINPPMMMDDAVRPLAALRAPLGVWSVPGNHDHPYWVRHVLKRFGLQQIAGRRVDVGPVQLVGSDDLILNRRAVPQFRAAVAGASPAKPLIALVHEPDLWGVLPPNIDLLLAGHTHGGQIRLFGWPKLEAPLDHYRRGLFRNAQGQQLLVSAGIGTSIVPLRLGVPPEILLVELVPAPAAP